ncbi:hypothetical protein RC74_15260 [Falsihalocynthiibacter arcticus]|uniref:Uncharacterized protein n=2 Tax=Falsihalocynthiibacter arcticus TaxID=1579316 RepID=A0A126V2D8_9RHOB|nr:hypothetical protein RC74_15260 [Falsihalocynthiibacter arcticus]
MALHIEKSTKFALEKPAGVACPNLAPTGLCRIHDMLKDKGFSGCIAYDCLGAGQRVVQDLYDGISWQQDPSLLGQMSEDFAKMRKIHTLLELLFTAQTLALPPTQLQTCDSFIARLFPQTGWTRAEFDAFPIRDTQKQVMDFLAALKSHLTAQQTK